MRRKGSWISTVKKVLSPPSKEKKQKKTRKPKRWFWKKSSKRLETIYEEVEAASPRSIVPEASWVEAEAEQTKYVDSVVEAVNDEGRHAYPVINTEIAQGSNADLAMDYEPEHERRAHAVACTTAPSSEAAEQPPSTSKEEIASVKIQAIFKGHMARRSMRSTKGLVRLKKLVQGQSVKRQAKTTLRYMQTMSRVQAEVRGRRIRMSEENCAFQRQLQLKHDKELEKSRYIGEEWNGSSQSKEQFEAKQQKNIEAAIKRERALAYAYSRQRSWRNSSQPTHTFMDSETAQWGWNWLEKWMALRPWENSAIEKEQIHAKSVTTLSQTRRDLGLMKKNPSQIVSRRQSHVQGRPSVSSPQTKTQNSRPPSHKRSISSDDGDARSAQNVQSDRCRRHSVTQTSARDDETVARSSALRADGDARSAQSVQSDRCRRHSVTQTSARDDESVERSSALRSYMVPTASTKAKSRLSLETTVLAAKNSTETTKKRLSFSTTPSAPRRHSVLF